MLHEQFFNCLKLVLSFYHCPVVFQNSWHGVELRLNNCLFFVIAPIKGNFTTKLGLSVNFKKGQDI